MVVESSVCNPSPLCRICGYDESSLCISKAEHGIWECRRCGAVFSFPVPKLNELALQYNDSYFSLYHQRRSFRIRRGDARLRKIEAITKTGMLLDIGCSLGYFIEAATRRGWNAQGVEISAYASEQARNSGCRVTTGTLEAAKFPSDCFDCITMWDVIEHIPDPYEHLIELRRVLKPGALVVIGTPNIGHVMFQLKRSKWRHLKPAEHLFYYRKSSIARLLNAVGFEIVTPLAAIDKSISKGNKSYLLSWVADTVPINDVMTIYATKK